MPEKLTTPLASILMKYRVSQAFGVRNPHYKSGIHNGTDYAVPEGTEVHACADGTIPVVWKNHPSMGNACLYEFYRDGRMHTLRLLHLKTAPKKGGYRRGSVIGFTGNTGDSTGPHLHLEVWKGGYEYEALLSERTVRERLVDPQVFFGLTA